MRPLFLISANFIFYITFVQFGLLKMIHARFGLPLDALGVPLGIMAVTGAATSVLAGYLIDRYSAPMEKVFNTACVLSVTEGIIALLAVNVYDQKLLIPLFLALGFFMGTNGVLVIRAAEVWLAERRGIMAGWAMAIVYLAANIIAGFVTLPEMVALINGILVIVTGGLCMISNVRMHPYPTPGPSRDRVDNQLPYVLAVAILSALVAVDSFIFHIETNRTEIYKFTWEDKWFWNGIVHAAAAVAAGVIWDRRGARPLFQISLLTFAVSLAVLVLFPVGPLTGLVSVFFYNTAVSFYGILMLILWFYTDSRPGTGLRIGLGMGSAGWLASPLGIALAMKTMSESMSLLFTGLLVIIMFLSLLQNSSFRRS